jgi:hypothetical protein
MTATLLSLLISAGVSLLAKVSLVGRPFRVENGVVVALSTPFTSRALGIAPWALHCCR